MLVANGLRNNISMQALGVGLEVPFLIEGIVYIPFVDRLGERENGRLFTYPLFQVIGGNDGKVLALLVPGS